MNYTLDFKNLEGRPWISNAKIYFPNGYVLSVSKNDETYPGEHHWAVGATNDYEVAIMLNGSLMIMPEILGTENNILSHVTDEELKDICNRMEKLPRPEKIIDIEIFDTLGSEPKAWHRRFTSVVGTIDFSEKHRYALNVWGKDGVRLTEKTL